MPRVRLSDLPCASARQYSLREIGDMVPRAEQQLAKWDAAGVSRAKWHELIGRKPAQERDEDITTLVIAMLEGALPEDLNG